MLRHLAVPKILSEDLCIPHPSGSIAKAFHGHKVSSQVVELRNDLIFFHGKPTFMLRTKLRSGRRMVLVRDIRRFG